MEEKIEYNNINFDNNIYNIKAYTSRNKIILEIESESKKYLGEYDLEHLKEFAHFQRSRDLRDAWFYFQDLFYMKYSIKKQENIIELLSPMARGDVKLKLFLKDSDKYYDHLSDKMKSIIDNNQLILGIDLGTTSSCASVMIDNDIIMIRNSLGSTTTPSFISFINKNEIYVGELAKLLPSNENNIIYQIKRLMGKSYN